MSWGYSVKIGSSVGGDSCTYFSGTDAERLADLQLALDDVNVKAILCGRGGYGTGRIIEKIDFSAFVQSPKWLIGFSDITVLHSHIFSNFGISTLHAPMAGAFNDGGAEREYVLSLKQALEGITSAYPGPDHPFNKLGTATGQLVGGNLALLAHLVGSSSDLNTDGKLLFIEDVGEYLYNIDRMMYQLKRSGKLDNLAGLIIGGFSDCKDMERPFGKTVFEIINDIVKDYNYPICFDFPVSHTEKNYALKIGQEYMLRIDATGAVLAE
jgi:muramoyltetrapeptide carboxypeptidase